jgi:hypothetical protein
MEVLASHFLFAATTVLRFTFAMSPVVSAFATAAWALTVEVVTCPFVWVGLVVLMCAIALHEQVGIVHRNMRDLMLGQDVLLRRMNTLEVTNTGRTDHTAKKPEPPQDDNWVLRLLASPEFDVRVREHVLACIGSELNAFRDSLEAAKEEDDDDTGSDTSSTHSGDSCSSESE